MSGKDPVQEALDAHAAAAWDALCGREPRHLPGVADLMRRTPPWDEEGETASARR